MQDGHGHGLSVYTWACKMDKGMHYVYGRCSMDAGMEHGHGHAGLTWHPAWTGICSMDIDMQHEHGHGLILERHRQLTTLCSEGFAEEPAEVSGTTCKS
jgi:hypothetical protein